MGVTHFSSISATNGVHGDVVGNVTGAASENVLKSGDTMTGTLILNAPDDTSKVNILCTNTHDGPVLDVLRDNTSIFSLDAAGNFDSTGNFVFQSASAAIKSYGARSTDSGAKLQLGTNETISWLDAEDSGFFLSLDSNSIFQFTAPIGYTPTTATDWDGTPPTTIGAALDRCAALLKALNSGTGP